MGDSANKLLTADDVAERWQVGRSHVYALARDGKIPVVKIGRYYRFRVEALEEFEQAGGTTDDATPR